MSAQQRLLPVAASSRTHADCHQAVAGPDRERTHGGQLREVQRSFAPVAAIKADPMTAHPGHEQVLTTLKRHASWLTGFPTPVIRHAAARPAYSSPNDQRARHLSSQAEAS